jgi:ecotin
VELIVGRNVEVDCNRHQFSGRIKTETLEARGVTIYRVELGPMSSTRMACPDPSRRRRFVTLSGRPYVVPYDADRPLVVYAPKDAVLRWRIWRPDRSLQLARPF